MLNLSGPLPANVIETDSVVWLSGGRLPAQQLRTVHPTSDNVVGESVVDLNYAVPPETAPEHRATPRVGEYGHLPTLTQRCISYRVAAPVSRSSAKSGAKRGLAIYAIAGRKRSGPARSEYLRYALPKSRTIRRIAERVWFPLEALHNPEYIREAEDGVRHLGVDIQPRQERGGIELLKLLDARHDIVHVDDRARSGPFRSVKRSYMVGTGEGKERPRQGSNLQPSAPEAEACFA